MPITNHSDYRAAIERAAAISDASRRFGSGARVLSPHFTNSPVGRRP